MSQQKQENLDVVALLVKNFREERPLLEGAVLFRGSRFGDQVPSTDTPGQLHAHLLPQVAASYTHAWKKTEAFIDTYPIDREKTQFFANYNLDEHLKGGKVTAYSVQDVERGIRPLVENLAYSASSAHWDKNVENLERFIKSSFYEAGVPIRQLDGSQTQPQAKYFYSGDPKAASAKDVLDKLERMTPQNEVRAKALYAMARPTEAAKAIGRLEAMHPEASRAFKVLQQAVQRDQAATVLTKHGNKPLMDFIAATRTEPAGEAQARVVRLAQGLAQSLDSADVNVRARALTVTRQIGAIEPASATMKDVSQAISQVSTKSRSAEPQAASRPIQQTTAPAYAMAR